MTALRSLTFSRGPKFLNRKNSVNPSTGRENPQQTLSLSLPTSSLIGEASLLHGGRTLSHVNISLSSCIWHLTPHPHIAAFTKDCRIVAHTSVAAAALLPRTSPEGELYYRFEYDVILLFGLTELQAQISWLENVRISSFCTASTSTNSLKTYRVSKKGMIQIKLPEKSPDKPWMRQGPCVDSLRGRIDSLNIEFLVIVATTHFGDGTKQSSVA